MGGQNARISKHSAAGRMGWSISVAGLWRLRVRSVWVAKTERFLSILRREGWAGAFQLQGCGGLDAVSERESLRGGFGNAFGGGLGGLVLGSLCPRSGGAAEKLLARCSFLGIVGVGLCGDALGEGPDLTLSRNIPATEMFQPSLPAAECLEILAF